MTPPTTLRVLALLNFFRKEKGVTDLTLNDDVNKNDLKILQSLTRSVHTEMMQEAKKANIGSTTTPAWGKLLGDIKKKYALVLEARAKAHGFPIYRCKDCWCASKLLFEIHKRRLTKKSKENEQGEEGFDR